METRKHDFPPYMKCTNCEQLHIVIRNVRDYEPTCAKCNGINFKPVFKNPGGKFLPEFCNQQKDKEIWDGTMAIILGPIFNWTKRMETKYKITFSKPDVIDLATSLAIVTKLMLNWTRIAFEKNKFVMKMKEQYNYILRNQKKNK